MSSRGDLPGRGDEWRRGGLSSRRGESRKRALAGRYVAPVVAAVLALLFLACGRKVVLTDIDEDRFVPGGGIEAAATLIDDEAALKSLFKSIPPDSGVVPVYVTVRNVDSRPLRIHNLNYLQLGDVFRGFTLDVDGNILDPIHPLEAVMYIKGKAKVPDYKEIHAKHVIGGIIIWPLGVYYIVRGVQYTSEYRPLLRNSFFPAGRGGYFDPVTLEPGETRSGFIYFALLPEDNPYYRESPGPGAGGKDEEPPFLLVRDDTGLRLDVNPAIDPPSYSDCEVPVDSTVILRGFSFARSEDGSPSPGPDGPSPGDFFALVVNGKRGGRLDLVIGNAREVFTGRSVEGLTVISTLTGKKADLVDASTWGDRAVCAVNSKQSARLFLVEWAGGKPVLSAEELVDRKVRRVMAAGDAVYVTTENGFTATYEYDRLRTKRYVNMGNKVDDVMMVGEMILAFGKRSVVEYGIRPGRNPEKLREVPVSSSKKECCGITGEGLVIKHVGRGTHGDTLVLYDPQKLVETYRQPFPGRVSVIDVSTDGVLVQMTGGMIMRIARREGEYATYEAGWVPESAVASGMSGGIVTLVSGDGRLYSFRLSSIVPEPLVEGGAVTVPVGVGTPYGEPEKKEKKRGR